MATPSQTVPLPVGVPVLHATADTRGITSARGAGIRSVHGTRIRWLLASLYTGDAVDIGGLAGQSVCRRLRGSTLPSRGRLSAAMCPEPTAMAVATVDAVGLPDVGRC